MKECTIFTLGWKKFGEISWIIQDDFNEKWDNMYFYYGNKRDAIRKVKSELKEKYGKVKFYVEN